MVLIINYLIKSRGGGREKAYMGINIWGIKLVCGQGIGRSSCWRWMNCFMSRINIKRNWERQSQLGFFKRWVLGMYWVHYFGGYIWRERIQPLGGIHRNNLSKVSGHFDRDIFGKIYFLRVIFNIYNFNYCSLWSKVVCKLEDNLCANWLGFSVQYSQRSPLFSPGFCVYKAAPV